MNHPIVIAVDGSAASGKGTLARGLAKEYGLDYLDTGSLYRAAGWMVLRNGGNPNNRNDAVRGAESIHLEEVDDALLRFDEISRAAASVAAIQDVRLVLLNLQRQFAKAPPSGVGCVMDGRDIGTVVFPQADLKFFVTARPEVRARRRYLELVARDPSITEAEILREIEVRDRRDSERTISPMKPAADAIILDTTELEAHDVLKRAMKEAASRLPLGKP
jgi:cytidylate kinase